MGAPLTPQSSTITARGTGAATPPPHPPRVTLAPSGDTWAGLVREHAAKSASDPRIAQFRRELGLPDSGPVVMSGHQAQWWHAGILAKQVALAVACRQTKAAAAWIVVDHDASDSLDLLYPAAPKEAGSLPTRGHWSIGPEALAAQLRADVAFGDLPAFTPSAPPTDAATPDAARALRAIADCTARWSHASNAAEQIARANAELAATVVGADASPTLLFATRLSATTAMRELLEKMASDPAACVGAYNRAVAEVNAPGVAPLTANAERNRFELPLWQLSPKGKPTPRKRVFAHALGDTPLDSLAPRALLMTALLRWLGCDLFIHGLGGGATGNEGGGGYDKVAERWFTHWLGIELAPSVVATATVLLPMGESGPLLGEEDLLAAQHMAHRGRHHPRLLGDAAAQAEKDRLVSAIAASTDRTERHRLFRDLQTLLDRYRTNHQPELNSLRQGAANAKAELERQSVLRERTWPWPLLPRPLLLELRRTVAAQMGA